MAGKASKWDGGNDEVYGKRGWDRWMRLFIYLFIFNIFLPFFG